MNDYGFFSKVILRLIELSSMTVRIMCVFVYYKGSCLYFNFNYIILFSLLKIIFISTHNYSEIDMGQLDVTALSVIGCTIFLSVGISGIFNSVLIVALICP